MERSQKITALLTGLSIACACVSARADESENGQTDEFSNTVKLGVALARFNTQSGDLSGPPGTTPPGVQVGLKNPTMVAFSYQRWLSNHWSIMFQGGIPPTVHMQGAGSAAGSGDIATAKVWFPALFATYTFTDFHGIRPYVGLGVHYTFMTNGSVTSTYTNAFHGTSSSIKFKDAWGPVARLGAEYLITKRWVLDLSYIHYWMKSTATITTATPGFGNISRTIDVKANPDVFGVMIGYRF
ncbi:OmpW/AlkL family protein [Burkholderia sp. IMCC1007]|uniref:OmpW/AlkL family protein n=1 Tax=Burkholderia sp. IMCC1007 TaxID=3004104 RepID=UPI0022B426DC|nr:OmpW family outer membrane protein [Burkholderia sp. IMCC1007]